MKPVVSALNAWTCIVISVFAIVILSVLGALFNANHHGLMDSTDDPESGSVVAGTAFAAVGVYGVCVAASSLHRCSSTFSVEFCLSVPFSGFGWLRSVVFVVVII